MPLAFARRLIGRKRSAAADGQLGFALAFVAGAIRTTHITGVGTDIGIELGKLLYWNAGRRTAVGRVVADRPRLGVLIRLASAFVCGGVIGALGFKQFGYVSTLPLALLLVGLPGVPAGDDLVALVRQWRGQLRLGGQRK